MKPTVIAFMLVLLFGAAPVSVGAIGSEPPETTTESAKPEAAADSGAEKEEPLAPPPGFKMKRHGKFLLYCKREAPMGTRLKSETCYDEQQMRDYLLALEQGKVDIDRARAICSNPCVCGMDC